jgi:hypothetical protein
MKQDTYGQSDPQPTDQELYQSIYSSITAGRAFQDPTPPLTIVDYPCGLGKTNALLSILEARPDLLVLVVVQTLSEVDRIISSVPKGRIYAPEGPGSLHRTKGEQLEPLVHAGRSIVITHNLYERAGILANQGAFSSYQVIIDEVPNAVSVSDLVLDPVSFKEFYIDPGYFSLREGGLVVMTYKGDDEEARLKQALDERLISNIRSGRLYYDGKKHFIQTIPTSLFTHADSVTVLTFLSEGSLFLKFLEKHQIDYRVLRSSKCNQEFQQRARENLKIHRMPSLDKMSFGYSKQTSYKAKSKEVRSIRNALKNLKQRDLAGVDLKNLIITCAKQNWFHRSGSSYNEAKPSLFSIDSRMFKGANWLPNTTRGTNDYLHCTHAIYLYEQNANPILLNWLNANDAQFKSDYSLTEMVQWIWRTRLRRGEPVHVYMPSKRMRGLLQAWLTLGASED